MNIMVLIDLFNYTIGILQNLCWFITAVSILLFIYRSLFNIPSRSVKYTTEKLAEFKKNGKYIPGIFVELNESKEILRYFIYGAQWKKRIIEKYNNIYKNSYGNILREATTDKELCFNLDNNLAMTDVEKAIDKALEYHKSLHGRKIQFKEIYKESQPIFEIVSWPYTEALGELQKYACAVNCNYMVLIGSAGNGKTNLLCSIAELTAKLGHAVLFLNSRDIKGDIIDQIFDCLNVYEKIKCFKKWYFKILNCILWFKGKRCFVFIDAVNENDDDSYGEEVHSFVNFMGQFSQFKIVVSCRNEYYKERFEKYLSENIDQKYMVYDIKSGDYNTSAIDRVIRKYREYYKYKGIIADNVLYVLCGQLLLLRIFFEVYRDSDKDVLTIRKHELFYKYIERVESTIAPNIEEILNLVADTMLKNMCFDSVDKTVFTETNKTALLSSIEETVLLGQKLFSHEDSIAKSVKEVIYFVFDELRDYYVARRLMQTYVTENSVAGDEIIKVLLSLRNVKASCEEGVVHYSYIFFRTSKIIAQEDKDYYCQKILNFYRLPEGYNYIYQRRHNGTELVNYGLRIIITANMPLTGFEKEFILDCLKKCPEEDGHQLFLHALDGTLYGLEFNLCTYLDLVFELKYLNETLHALNQISNHDYISDDDCPFDLIYYHKKVKGKYPERALQIQEVAEVCLLFNFNDVEKGNIFKEYFSTQPDHDKLRVKIKDRFLKLKKRRT